MDQSLTWTKVSLDNCLLGLMCPWTIVSLDNCPLDNCSLDNYLLGQLYLGQMLQHLIIGVKNTSYNVFPRSESKGTLTTKELSEASALADSINKAIKVLETKNMIDEQSK